MSKSQRNLKTKQLPFMCLAADPDATYDDEPKVHLPFQTPAVAVTHPQLVKKQPSVELSSDWLKQKNEAQHQLRRPNQILPQKRRSRTPDYSKGGNSIYLTRPLELLKQARQFYRENYFNECVAKLLECCRCSEWQLELSLEIKDKQPKLYQFHVDCYLLAAHAEMKLGRFRKAIDSCEEILIVEDNFEALIVKANALAALSHYPEAIVCYKQALVLQPGEKDCIEQINILRKSARNRIRQIPQDEQPVNPLQIEAQNSVSQSGLSALGSTIGSTYNPSDSNLSVNSSRSLQKGMGRVLQWFKPNRLCWLLFAIFLTICLIRRRRMPNRVPLRFFEWILNKI